MRLIPIEKLTIPKRQRSSIDRDHLMNLKESILARGLLHPVVVDLRPDGEAVLVAGETRTEAIKLIFADEQFFMCDGKPVMPGELPIITLADLSPADLMAAEFEENFIRKDLSWQDRARALAAIHEARKEVNPDQSVRATARELSEKGGIVGSSPEGKSRSVSHLERQIADAVVVTQHFHDASVRNARNPTEALSQVYRKEERAFQAELVKRTTQLAGAAPTLIEVRHGSLLEVLPALDADQFDLLVADPPYGLGANTGGYRSRSSVHHNYEDTPENARLLMQCILTEGFRVTKSRANIFIFFVVNHWTWLSQVAAQAGWVPFPRPIIWQKSHSEGMAPWGRQGFRYTFDMIFFATKGQRGLIHSPVDILDHPRVLKGEREHGAEKPGPLLEELINAATLPNDYILDPCCGSGSTLQAARKLKRRAMGVEIDEDYYNLALTRVNEPEAADPELAAL